MAHAQTIIVHKTTVTVFPIGNAYVITCQTHILLVGFVYNYPDKKKCASHCENLERISLTTLDYLLIKQMKNL